VLTLRSCGETPVTIVDVGLETGENLACVGYHCEYYVVDGVSPMTLGPYETMEVLVHYSPAKVFDLDEQGQALPDRATVLVLFDGGELAVPVIGIGVSAPCASPHVTMYSQDMEIADGDTVAVGTTLSFVATPTCDDAPANAWEWFLDPPEGATATFVPSSTAENPTLTVTSPGEYAVSSVVSDKDDGGSCAPTTVTFWVDGSL
jgi:hypothetical protein